MTQWNVSTKEKKSVEEHEMWEKDGQVIVRISGFRWGTWIVTTSDENPPEFDREPCPGGSDDPDSVDMYGAHDNNIEEVELVSLDDGWYGEVQYPEDMTEEEQERLEELWDEDAYCAWEEEGWTQTDTECWAWGEFEIDRIDA
jgi:hypothetical protein